MSAKSAPESPTVPSSGSEREKSTGVVKREEVAVRSHVQRASNVRIYDYPPERSGDAALLKVKSLSKFVGRLRPARTGLVSGIDLENVISLAARAVEVLGTRDRAMQWVTKPIRSLGNETPLSLIQTSDGIQRVEDALGRIEHGIW